MINLENIQIKITKFIKEKFNVKDSEDFNTSVNLFEEGYVDSMGLVDLISFLEDEFNIELCENYLYDERFLNIKGLSEIIAEILG